MKKFLCCLLLFPCFSFADTLSDTIFAENRLAFGTKLSEQNYIQKIGLKKWINEQLVGNTLESTNLTSAISNLQIPNITDIFTQLKIMKENQDKDGINNFEKNLYEKTVTKEILLSLYSNNQLRQRMTWFWFNHLNIYSGKGLDKVLFSDYEDNVIRKNALGNFKQLLLASLKSPAMLFYLDNFQNIDPQSISNQKNPDKIKGINENYARELLELHTLGQGNGYTQKDIQELARVLTGFTFLNNNQEIKIPLKFESQFVQDGLFIFDPRKHDFGDKQFMGHVIKGKGYSEINQVIDILISNPLTAENISKKLAIYFINDEPSSDIIHKMSKKFLDTKGDIQSVLNVIFNSKEFWQQANNFSKFKLPNEYIYSIVRLTYDDNLITDTKPILRQLIDLGQKPYGKLTPDGYPLKNKDWESSDQLGKRFNISLVFNRKKLPLNPEFIIDYDLAYTSISSVLSNNTKDILQQAKPQERFSFLLSSPEMVKK